MAKIPAYLPRLVARLGLVALGLIGLLLLGCGQKGPLSAPDSTAPAQKTTPAAPPVQQ